jgi:hypothetical protein
MLNCWYLTKFLYDLSYNRERLTGKLQDAVYAGAALGRLVICLINFFLERV